MRYELKPTKPHELYVHYLRRAVPQELAARAANIRGDATDEELAQYVAQAELIVGLFDTATGAARGDTKTALALLRRLDPSWGSLFEEKPAEFDLAAMERIVDAYRAKKTQPITNTSKKR